MLALAVTRAGDAPEPPATVTRARTTDIEARQCRAPAARRCARCSLVSAMIRKRTQVAIVGAGPAGLLLGHLLHRLGVDAVILESRSRAYVEQRVRAGVLEQGSVDLLVAAGVGERLQREGLVHHGIELRFGGTGHRIDLTGLSGGRSITVYGQQEVVKDLIRARLAVGGEILFDVDSVTLHDVESSSPQRSLSLRRRSVRASLRIDRRLRRLSRRLPALDSAGRAAQRSSAPIRSLGWASWRRRRRPAMS